VRPAVQERKAELCLQLHQAIRRPPPELSSASVQGTRQWLERYRQARRIKGDPRASVRELSEAIEAMAQPFPLSRPRGVPA
jgi:hypothetical protein